MLSNDLFRKCDENTRVPILTRLRFGLINFEGDGCCCCSCCWASKHDIEPIELVFGSSFSLFWFSSLLQLSLPLADRFESLDEIPTVDFDRFNSLFRNFINLLSLSMDFFKFRTRNPVLLVCLSIILMFLSSMALFGDDSLSVNDS